MARKSHKRTAGKTRDGTMTTGQAGYLGGMTTKRTHGRRFYATIGRKGGRAVSQNRRHMAAIGRIGGQTSRSTARSRSR